MIGEISPEEYELAPLHTNSPNQDAQHSKGDVFESSLFSLGIVEGGGSWRTTLGFSMKLKLV